MKMVALSSLFVYGVVFVLMQQIVGGARGAKNIRKQETPQLFLLVLSVKALSQMFLILGVVTMANDDFNRFLALRWVGCGVIILGLLLSVWSQYVLGPNWVGGVAVHKGHQLITSGPYRYVRHPLYSGMWLSALGICMVSLNVWYGLAAVCFCGCFSLRIPAEENIMEHYFPEYAAYKSRTGALMPRIRRKG